ncbi:hypothetical protein [Maricaulis sp.]|uniref:hypothetical protein n=1 Tax=Maricaulis sp. TaxID=1486257 RepID=UPI003A91A1BE
MALLRIKLWTLVALILVSCDGVVGGNARSDGTGSGGGGYIHLFEVSPDTGWLAYTRSQLTDRVLLHRISSGETINLSLFGTGYGRDLSARPVLVQRLAFSPSGRQMLVQAQVGGEMSPMAIILIDLQTFSRRQFFQPDRLYRDVVFHSENELAYLRSPEQLGHMQTVRLEALFDERAFSAFDGFAGYLTRLDLRSLEEREFFEVIDDPRPHWINITWADSIGDGRLVIGARSWDLSACGAGTRDYEDGFTRDSVYFFVRPNADGVSGGCDGAIEVREIGGQYMGVLPETGAVVTKTADGNYTLDGEDWTTLNAVRESLQTLRAHGAVTPRIAFARDAVVLLSQAKNDTVNVRVCDLSDYICNSFEVDETQATDLFAAPDPL